MCLAVPAKIVELNGENAVVDIQGVRREAIVTFIADPKIGDYVLLHAGFAIRKWSKEDAREFYAIVNGTAEE
jgi:hydrogenase expression/formation protein HypC